MLKIKKSVVEIQFSDLVWHSMERLAAHLASSTAASHEFLSRLYSQATAQ